MALDWSKCSAVESVPGKVSGAWVFRGTRLPVATIFENLEDGMSIEEIMEQFDVTREQVTAVLDFAARSLYPPFRRCCFNLGQLIQLCPRTAYLSALENARCTL